MYMWKIEIKIMTSNFLKMISYLLKLYFSKQWIVIS